MTVIFSQLECKSTEYLLCYWGGRVVIVFLLLAPRMPSTCVTGDRAQNHPGQGQAEKRHAEDCAADQLQAGRGAVGCQQPPGEFILSLLPVFGGNISAPFPQGYISAPVGGMCSIGYHMALVLLAFMRLYIIFHLQFLSIYKKFFNF